MSRVMQHSICAWSFVSLDVFSCLGRLQMPCGPPQILRLIS
jgi:hypothetical protein